jgi:hypothetical protein
MEIYPLWRIQYNHHYIWQILQTRTVILLITRWYISSVMSLQAWMISVLNTITVCSFFGKIFSLRNPQRNLSHGFKSGLFEGQFCPHAKQSGNWFEMTHELKVSCRKSKTTFAMCSLAPSCMNHWVCNSKPVARRLGTKVLCNMRNL